jgi:hypothetical protein
MQNLWNVVIEGNYISISRAFDLELACLTERNEGRTCREPHLTCHHRASMELQQTREGQHGPRRGWLCVPIERTTKMGVNPQWPEGITAQGMYQSSLNFEKIEGLTPNQTQ